MYLHMVLGGYRKSRLVSSSSSFAVLNTDSPTRLPGNASASLITSSEWQTHTTMSSDHLHILIGLQTTVTPTHVRHRTYINLRKADWTRYRQENASCDPVIFQLIAKKTRRVPTISAYMWWNRRATNDACKSRSLLS